MYKCCNKLVYQNKKLRKTIPLGCTTADHKFERNLMPNEKNILEVVKTMSEVLGQITKHVEKFTEF